MVGGSHRLRVANYIVDITIIILCIIIYITIIVVIITVTVTVIVITIRYNIFWRVEGVIYMWVTGGGMRVDVEGGGSEGEGAAGANGRPGGREGE